MRSVGYILQECLRDIFCRGGEFELIPMYGNKGSNRTTWTVPSKQFPRHYLRVGIPGSDIFTVSSEVLNLNHDTKFQCPKVVYFMKNARLNLQDDHYYCPRASDRVTFDSFVYQKKGETRDCLSSITAKKHDVEGSDFVWLETLGVQEDSLCGSHATGCATLFQLPIYQNHSTTTEAAGYLISERLRGP